MKQKKGRKRVLKSSSKGKRGKDRGLAEGTSISQSSRSELVGKVDTKLQVENRDDDCDGNDNDAQIEINIQLADKCFMRNEFDEAVDLYLKAKKCMEENSTTGNQSFVDVNIKVSNILQGQGKLSKALELLIEARGIYSECLQQTEIASDQTMRIKLVEIVTGIANLYVDQREIEKASDTYQEAIKTSRELFESEEQIANTLSNFANFLYTCKQDYVGAIERLKEVLKIQLQSSNGSIHPNSAATLNSMGKIYMTKSKASNSKEGTKDAERAEACFSRALQLLRFSMVPSSDERVVDTTCWLNAARGRQTATMGILRNVRFDALPINTEEIKLHAYSSDSGETSGSFYEDLSKLSTHSDLSRDDKKAYDFDLSFTSLFGCGAMEMHDIEYSIDSEVNPSEQKLNES